MRLRLRVDMRRVRSTVIAWVVDVLIVLVLVSLVWAVLVIGQHVWLLVTGRLPDAFKSITAEVLSVFIFIEIFNALVEYLNEHRIRVTYLADATLAFVLREVWVSLYSAEGSSWQRLLALSALVLALGAIRTLAVVFSPRERDQAFEG